jgi:hypothetical protein
MSYAHEFFPIQGNKVLAEIADERDRQDAKWGEQNHPDGTGHQGDRVMSDYLRTRCQRRFEQGAGTWRDILQEEMGEAYAESEPANLRSELIQLAAVVVAWVEAIDRRSRPASSVRGGVA